MRVDVDDMPAADRRGAPIVRQHWHLGTLPVVDDLSGDGSHRHGFQKLKEACFEFVSGLENYGLRADEQAGTRSSEVDLTTAAGSPLIPAVP